jgi:DNA-binding IclR family transcriptional regulator
VAAHRERTGAGPSWSDLRRHTGWPREITDGLLGKLREAGWLAYDDEPGSLRPGPAARRWRNPETTPTPTP